MEHSGKIREARSDDQLCVDELVALHPCAYLLKVCHKSVGNSTSTKNNAESGHWVPDYYSSKYLSEAFEAPES